MDVGASLNRKEQDMNMAMPTKNNNIDPNAAFPLEDFGDFVQRNTGVNIDPLNTSKKVFETGTQKLQKEQVRLDDAYETADWSKVGNGENVDTNPDAEQSVADLVATYAEYGDITEQDLKTKFPEFAGKEQSVADLFATLDANGGDITDLDLRKKFPELLNVEIPYKP